MSGPRCSAPVAPSIFTPLVLTLDMKINWRKSCSSSPVGIFGRVYVALWTPFSLHGPRVYTARGKLPAWASTPIYPPGPYTHWRYIGFHSNLNVTASRFREGGAWVDVLLHCLHRNNECSDIIMSSSNWRESVICELLIMWERVMQSY